MATFNVATEIDYCKVCGTGNVPTTTQYYDDDTLEVVTVDANQDAHSHEWRSGSGAIWNVYTLADGTVGLSASEPYDDEHTTTIARDLPIGEAFSQAQRYADEHAGYTFDDDYTDEAKARLA